MNYFGIIGLILIGLGWIPQVVEIIKEKKSNLNLKFALLYTFGSLALTIHAVLISDLIFILLNAFATFMSGVGLYYTIKT